VAGLGVQTTLQAGSTLQSVHGFELGTGEVLSASDDARVVGLFSNHGQVRGPSAGAHALVFNDDVGGGGSFAGSVRFNQLYSPGDGVGIVNLGRFELASTATMDLELAGAQPGSEHDQLQIGSEAVLDGTLALDFTGGWAPQAGQSLVLMRYASHSGLFDALRVNGLDPALSAQLDYGSDELRLSISAVPEPGSWALMLGGVLTLLRLQRRRQRND
jgi:hypothetical protein